MSSSLVTNAARNNAEWCDLVCRTHRVPGEFYQHSWINRHETPPFYPNLVTLDESKSTHQYEAVRELVEMDIPVEWAVKDSFSTLDLSSDGFRELLAGDWIRWPASSKMPEVYPSGVRWAKIADRKDLMQWERGWRGSATTSSDRLPMHPATTVSSQNAPTIMILSSSIRDGKNSGSLSDEKAKEFRSGCMAAILEWSKGLQLVGYESGQDLVAMKSLGFETVGQLKVWVKSISSNKTGAP
jgi:hypothetical protein